MAAFWVADCYITVEAAGPNLPPMIEVVPNDIRTMAGWVISQCVIRASAQGGFVTQGFTRVLGYILQPLTILIDPYRKSTILTLSLPFYRPNVRPLSKRIGPLSLPLP